MAVPNIDQLVLGSVNASLRRCIDAPTLLAALHDPAIAGRWAAHLAAFFEDVPREAMLRFLVLHQVDAGVAALAYHRLVPTEADRDEDLDRWLTELANAA